MATPHDELFKAIYAEPSEAAAEFRAVLPLALVQRIDWSTLRRLSSELPDAVDAEQEADLLYAVRCGGRELLLHLLLEHKSREDRWVGLQVLGYAVRIWQRHRRDHPRARSLPPVIAVVVHHGSRPWRGPSDFAELFGLAPADRAAFGGCLPNHRFVLDDLTLLSEDELLSRVVSNVARLGLACLQRIRRGGDPAEVLRGLRGLFRAVLAEPSPSSRLVLVLSYLTKVWDLRFADTRELVRRELGPELEESMTSTYDQLVNHGIEQGLARGLAQGRAETLLEQMNARFGPVSYKIAETLRSASAAQLRAWTLRILTAATIEDVLEPPPGV